MTGAPGVDRDGQVEAVDARVSAVLEVLEGRALDEVAAGWKVDAALLERWVAAFVAAGTSAITNRPPADQARQRDRFLAAFAHEVRTPLTVAKGWTTMLADGSLSPEMAKGSLERLHAALDRLTERALDVELMAAASLGRLTLSPERVAVADLLTEVGGEEIGPVTVEGGEVQVTVDASLFRRVVRDLWDAAGGTPLPVSRRIEVIEDDPWTQLRVVREGAPIQPAVLQALFEPFDLNSDGTGVTIGLYLARALTVAHGGTLGVDQDEQQATFWVKIPGRVSL
jgi:signal transduction histidine kinase